VPISEEAKVRAKTIARDNESESADSGSSNDETSDDSDSESESDVDFGAEVGSFPQRCIPDNHFLCTAPTFHWFS
jgi:hypothetical protein